MARTAKQLERLDAQQAKVKAKAKAI